MVVRQLLLPLGFLACLAQPARAAQAEGRDHEFEVIVNATGDAYVEARSSWERAGPEGVAFLTTEAEKAGLWRRSLQAAIILQRSQRRADLGVLCGGEMNSTPYRIKSDTILSVGKSLAARFRGAPLLLVEYLWKGNELDKLRLVTGSGSSTPLGACSERYAYVAHALGLLKEKRGAHPLLPLVERGIEDPDSCYFAGEALSAIGEVSVFPDLLRIAGAGKDYLAKRSARQGSAGCFSADATALVKETMEKTSDSDLRLHCAILLASSGPTPLSPAAHPRDSSTVDLTESALTALRANPGMLRHACVEQGRACQAYLESDTAWAKSGTFTTNDALATARVLKLSSAAHVLAAHVDYAGIRDPEQRVGVPESELYPVTTTLEQIGIPAVPAMIDVLARSPLESGDGDAVLLKRDLLMKSLVRIFEQGGAGKEMARNRIRLAAGARPAAEKERLMSLLTHASLAANGDEAVPSIADSSGTWHWLLGMGAILLGGLVLGFFAGWFGVRRRLTPTREPE